MIVATATVMIVTHNYVGIAWILLARLLHVDADLYASTEPDGTYMGYVLTALNALLPLKVGGTVAIIVALSNVVALNAPQPIEVTELGITKF